MWNKHILRLLFCLLGMLPVSLTPVIAQTHSTASAEVSSSDAHAVLQRVLARREFENYRKDPGWLTNVTRSIGDAIVKWIIKPIGDIFDRIGNLFNKMLPRRSSTDGTKEAYSAVWRYLLYCGIAALVLLLLGLLIKYLISSRRLRDAENDLDTTDEDIIQRRKQEPSYWEKSLLQAEALWTAGNQRDALRVLNRACLVLLDARGVLRYEESRANGEVLRELRRQGKTEVQQALKPIVGSFDRSWYGFLPISADEFSAALESSRHFRAAVVEVHNA